MHNFKTITLSADRVILNPLLEPGITAKITAFGTTVSGEQVEIDPRQIKWNAQTLLTSSDAEVISVDQTGVVTPLNGGYAVVNASYVGVGHGLHASLKFIIRPFYHEYHKTLTYKLFLAMEEYGSLRNPGTDDRDASVFITFEEALDIIRRIDAVTIGMPKIVYLVGWQRGGHDHGYPQFTEVNPKLKRKEDAAAADSLRWLIREGKKYNTAISIHINLVDAWDDSPLWEEYKARHIIAENQDGSLRMAPGCEVFLKEHGILCANVCQKRLWESGYFHSQIDTLLKLLPEIVDSHTIHIDNWRAIGSALQGISAREDEVYIRKMFLYLRELGLDATSEGSFHGREEPMTGLQPMTWWDIPYHQSIIPPALYCGGRTTRVDSDPRFGESIHIENSVLVNLRRGRDAISGIQDEFCLYTLPWQFLNSFLLESYDETTACYEGGIKAAIENGIPVIMWNQTQIRRGSTVFVPMLWSDTREILMYSYRDTYLYTNLPVGWEDVASVDLYYVDPSGEAEPVLEISDYQINNGILAYSLDTRTAYIVRPHSQL